MNKKIFVTLVRLNDEEDLTEQAHKTYTGATDHLADIARKCLFNPDVIDSMEIVRFAVDKTFVPSVYKNITFEEKLITPESTEDESSD